MYYERNSAIVEACDELVVFRIKTAQSNGMGTADAVEKARKKGIPIKLFQYDLT